MKSENNGVLTFKRFISPLRWKFSYFLKLALVRSVDTIFWILTVEVFKIAVTAIQNSNYTSIKIYIFVYLTILIIYFIFWLITRGHSQWWVWYDWKKLFYNQELPHFFRLNNTYVEKIWTWKMQYIIDKWLESWNVLLWNSAQIVSLLITFIYSIIQIYNAMWLKFVCWFILLFILLYLIVKFANKHAVLIRQKRIDLESEFSRHFIKMVMSKMEILQNNREWAEIQKTNDILSESSIIQKKYAYYLRMMSWSAKIYSRILNIFILFYWFYIVKNWWNLTIFVWLIACSALFSSAVNDFINYYKTFNNQFVNVEKLRNTFDNIPKIKNDYKDIAFKYKKWEIEIENLTFWYNDSKNIFENFSLHLQWWLKIALVWESWSWKTTLIKLIAWYMTPNNWNIFVDWQDIHKVNLFDYYNHIWFLTQDPSVFDGTIYDNLVYALREQPSDAKFKKIIKAAKCEFIYDFTDWLQTEIWERWIRLSWGQKQRLAIAKIMLKNPNIILLDEPTSALDSFNEEEISHALNNLFKWKTVIIVAHRLQTVKSADRILLFENGKVVEDWTHQSLIKKDWKYKRMLDLQSGF